MPYKKSRVENMLELYKEKLKRASVPPADHVECYRLQAQISILEILQIYEAQDKEEQQKKSKSKKTKQEGGDES